jgi:hypothetical protein
VFSSIADNKENNLTLPLGEGFGGERQNLQLAIREHNPINVRRKKD